MPVESKMGLDQTNELVNGEVVNGNLPTDKPTQKARQQIGRVDQIYSKSKRKWEYYKTATRKPRRARWTDYVIFARTRFSDKAIPEEVEVDVKGQRLRDALLSIHSDLQTEFFSDGGNSEQVKNTKLLYHSREQLAELEQSEKAKGNKADEDLLFELGAGLKFVDEEFGSDMAALESLTSEGVITFPLLWMLYAPNCVTIGRDELGQTFAVIVRSSYLTKNNCGHPVYVLRADQLDHDGKDIGLRTRMTLNIYGFEGKMGLTELPFLPLKWHPNAEVIKEQLLVRWHKATMFHGRLLAEYKGHGLREGKDQLVAFNAHGRVMLDPASLEKTKPNNKLREGRFSAIKESEITEELRMTMSPKLYGFSLGDKTWGVFALSSLSSVVFNPGILKSLVLDREQKALIRDLVVSHQSTSNIFDDFVRFKGKGLIGLLSGSPGIGKTMTAEAIAEVAKCPLYMISSGELGDTPDTIHSRLKDIFELAELWRAVVLLDEADVFLSKRSETDLTRNAITSVFLRELEYYQGILILTTNRLDSFDPAFISRMHFSLEYPDLDAAGRESIWKSFLSRAYSTSKKGESKIKINVDASGCAYLSKHVLNGRQIKNIMSIAQSIALQRGEPITVKSIEGAIELCQRSQLGQDQKQKQVEWVKGVWPGHGHGHAYTPIWATTGALVVLGAAFYTWRKLEAVAR